MTRNGMLAASSAALLLLAGCQPELQIGLASTDERLPNPSFTVRDPAQPTERPLYNTIKVMAADGTLLWHLRAEPFGDMNSVARFTYGEALSGFVAVVGAQPLEGGKRYTVHVLGKKTGSLPFTVDASGKLAAVAEP